MENSKRHKVIQFLEQDRYILLDGATGTQLQAHGLTGGRKPETWVFLRPDITKEIQKSYMRAGSDIVASCTFGASAHKLAGSEYSSPETVTRAVQLTREAIQEYQAETATDREILAAFVSGPLGELMEPNGSLSFEAAYDDFAQQFRAAEKAGADLIYLETFSDLLELKAGLLAAKENSNLPVFCTMTFEPGGRTFAGTDVETFLTLAESLGALAVGVNCSQGPHDLRGEMEILLQNSPLHLIFKPNAGLPDPTTGGYGLDAQEFTEQILPIARQGIKIVGGCCGTTPDYIAALKAALEHEPFLRNRPTKVTRVCSNLTTVCLGKTPLIAGESLNPTGQPELIRDLERNTFSGYARLALQQEQAGAALLDLNCAYPGLDESRLMPSAVKAVQAVSSLPIMLDSADPEALAAGLRIVNGRPIINSLSARSKHRETILYLAKLYGAVLVLLPFTGADSCQSVAERIKITEDLIQQCVTFGIPKEDLLIDGLALSVSSLLQGPEVTLQFLAEVKAKLGIKTLLGLSNVSFGLPERARMNQVFLAQALAAGLDVAICRSQDLAIQSTFVTHRALHGQDPALKNYIHYFQNTTNRQPGTDADHPRDTAKDPRQALYQAVLNGLSEDAKTYANLLLQDAEPLSLIETIMLPALDKVAQAYNQGEIFLPQLIQNTKAAQAAIDLIQQKIQATSEAPQADERPPILFATVKGDIHDIGKNIALTLVENYNFPCVDLGRDVDPEVIAEKVQAYQSPLLGLSALMTTTLPAMEETIKLVKATSPDCKILVSGAVLTQDFADKVGADYYCPDAGKDIEVAKAVYRNL